MVAEKKGRKPKSRSRSRLELCVEKADKLVSKTENFIETAQDLKTRINGLGGGEFSKMAIGFNNLISETVATLEFAPFETTTREESAQATTIGKTFADYQKENTVEEGE